MDPDTAKVIAVNQFGETRELGQLDQEEYLNATSITLDEERALLFIDSNDTLRVYLLTLDGMQKIALPSDPFYFNTNLSQPSRTVIAVHGDRVVFSYVTEGGSNIMPDRGPILLVDLESLTTKLIDESVSRSPYNDNRRWIHGSQDGRYLRYLNGDEEKMDIRELDLVTGDTRTIYTASGSSFRIHASPEGDLWYPDNANLILDLNGNQMDFEDETRMFSPLKDGRGLVYYWNCVDNCEIEVFAPFGGDAALTYNLPWTIESATSNVRVRQLLPDQSLLFTGMPYATLSNTPAIVETYPDLTEIDVPLFRLTPDGQARLVGIYVEDDLASTVSPNGQFILMKSIDQTSFFIYDAVADRPLFDMPINTDLEDPLVTVRFFDNGILANLSAAVPGTQHGVYHYFYHVYDFKTSTTLNWEDENAEISGCPDLLDDGTLVCWFYRTDSSNNFDLVRFDPTSDTKTILLENVWLIDFTP